jgi:disulfide bond formation protein DsbB
MAGVAADAVVELGLVRNPSPVVHAIFALILLLIATWLGIYKPFGLTPYAIRTDSPRQPTSSTTVRLTTAPSGASSTPTALNIVALVVLAVMLVVVLLHLTGTSFGH